MAKHTLKHFKNIFNSIKRKIYSNIFTLCFAILTFVTKCYTTPGRVFVISGTVKRSNEGTTQINLVAMTIYPLGITPLIMITTDLLTSKCHNSRLFFFIEIITFEFFIYIYNINNVRKHEH